MSQMMYGLPVMNYQDARKVPGQTGDLFNGLLSLASYARKVGDDSRKLISTPISKFDVVSMFENENMVSVVPNNNQNIQGLHVCDIVAQAVRTNSPNLKLLRRDRIGVWDYFLARGITQEDILTEFYMKGTPDMSVNEEDVIVFPTTGGDGRTYFHPEFYLKAIDHFFPNAGKVYWNKEATLSHYKPNSPTDCNVLKMGIADMLATIIARNPRVIGHRSGIFDMMFHVLPTDRTSQVVCLYELEQPIHIDWCLKGRNVPEQFKEFSEKRKSYLEIGVSVS